MICEMCKEQIAEGDQCNHLGKILCEDCYVEAIEPPRTCDYSCCSAPRVLGFTEEK